MGSLFEKFKGGLHRTRDLVLKPLGGLLRLRHLDEAQLQEMEDLLLQADLGVAAVERLMLALRAELKRGSEIEPRAILKRELLSILHGKVATDFLREGTQVALLVGVNGAGKTTTLGKFAAHLRSLGREVLIVAGDTFRAAAIDQLEQWSLRAGVQMVRNQAGGDPAAVAFDGVTAAKARGIHWVLIDTAGRLHNKDHLMRELDKIVRSIRKVIPDAPHRVLLVLDATTGQNGLAQAEAFRHSAGVTDLVVTKLDGSAKGGVLVPIVQRLGLPVAFVGVGEGVDDLLAFSPEAFVDGLLDL